MTDKEKIKLLEKQIKLHEKVDEINIKLIEELQRKAVPVYPIYPYSPSVPANPQPGTSPWYGTPTITCGGVTV